MFSIFCYFFFKKIVPGSFKPTAAPGELWNFLSLTKVI
jgi:hypothetical protein